MKPNRRPTDIPLLNHIRLYQLTTHITAANVIFSHHTAFRSALKSAGEALAALTRRGYLRALYLPGKIKYFLLEPKAAEILGELPQVVTTAPGPQRLDLDLAVLWFCCMSESRFHRLTRDDLAVLYPTFRSPQNVIHCITDGPAGPVVYRMYLASAIGTPRCLKQIQKIFRDISNLALSTDPTAPRLGLSVMAPTPEAAEKLRSSVSETESIPLIVSTAPTSETLQRHATKYKRDLALHGAP